MGTDGMTRSDRETLARLARQRTKLAKMAADDRAAELMADFEQKIAARYVPADDPVWAELHAEANRAVAEADRRIAARCKELGIPANFRPGLSLGWYGRGENAMKDRQVELRRVARATIDMLTKKTKTAIERQGLEVATRIEAGGLETAAARAFLAAMPTAEALMPYLDIATVEAQLPTGRRFDSALPALSEPLENVEVDADLGAD